MRCLLIALLISLSAQAAEKTEALKPSLGEPAEMGSADKIVTPPSDHDDRRTSATLNSLASQSGWFPKMKIRVSEGVVILEGPVKSATQVEWLAKTADRLPGVIAVINRTDLEKPAVTDLSPIWNELRKLVESAKKSVPLVLMAFTMLLIFLFIGKYIGLGVRRQWGKHIANPFLLSTVARLTMLPVWALFFYLTLRTAGLSGLATTIIGGTGAASLVIGFAFKGIAENYLSGLLLAMRSPFTKGDEILVDKYAGFVQSLNMRGTTIVDYDGNVVLIPNTMVIQSVIQNRTVNKVKRLSFQVVIGFSDSIEKAQTIILAMMKSIPEILEKPGGFTNIDRVTTSGVSLGIFFWFDAGQSSGDKIKSLLVDKIKNEFIAQGITLPDAGRELIFTDALTVRMERVREEMRSTPAPAPAPPPPDAQNADLTKDSGAKDIQNLTADINVLQKPVKGDLLRDG